MVSMATATHLDGDSDAVPLAAERGLIRAFDSFANDEFRNGNDAQLLHWPFLFVAVVVVVVLRCGSFLVLSP